MTAKTSSPPRTRPIDVIACAIRMPKLPHRNDEGKGEIRSVATPAAAAAANPRAVAARAGVQWSNVASQERTATEDSQPEFRMIASVGSGRGRRDGGERTCGWPRAWGSARGLAANDSHVRAGMFPRQFEARNWRVRQEGNRAAKANAWQVSCRRVAHITTRRKRRKRKTVSMQVVEAPLQTIFELYVKAIVDWTTA